MCKAQNLINKSFLLNIPTFFPLNQITRIFNPIVTKIYKSLPIFVKKYLFYPYNNTSNITFVCPFSNLIKKTLDTQIKDNELLVNFKDYYVYDEENKLIDKAVLTTSNSNFNKFLICNHFPNKDCKTVFMYLVDSNQKASVSLDTNQYNEDYTSNFKEAEAISLNDSSLVYDIDIISKNIINKHYDPNSNLYEVELGEELEESEDKPLDNKQKEDVLLKLDLTNPYLTYELNGVKINDNLTSLNSLNLNNKRLDSSYILVSHNRLSNKSSFVIIKINYKTKKLDKISNSILIRVTRISCNNSTKSSYTKNNNSSSSTTDTSSGNGNDTVDSINVSAAGDSDDGKLPILADNKPVDTDVLSDDTDRSNAELLDTNHTDNNNINSISNSEHDRHRKPRIYNYQQANTDVGTNTLNKLDKNSNGDDIDEWILTENDEKYQKFISFYNCPLKIEVIRQNDSTDGKNSPIYFNGFKLNTNHYKVLVNSSTSFNIRFNNKTYKLEVSNDPIYKILNDNVAENMGNIASTVINDSTANTATANDFRRPEININGWVVSFVTMVIRIITFVNIFSNISRFYFESLNYITFLFLFYGYLSGNFDNGTNNSSTGNLLNKLTEKIISRLLIYIDNANNLVPVKMFLLLNLVYIVNMVAIMCYLSFVITSNFKPKLGKKLKKLETNILALFIYLLLLMVLVFLKFEGNNEDVYMMGGRFNSFCFSSMTLFITILIILIIYQLYPRRRMNHSLNNTLFSLLDDSKRGGIYPNSLPINSIHKSSNVSSPLNSLKTISGIKHTIGNVTKSKSTSPKSGNSNSIKFGGLVDFHGTLSTNNSDDPMLDSYRTLHSLPRQADEPNGNSKRDKVIINDKYRLLYINSLIIESTAIVVYYILTKREDGIYMVKFTFWLLISLYIQKLNRYYDEKKINKYLLIKSLKYMVLASLIRIHVLVQNKLLETGSGVGGTIFGVSIGQFMALIILIHVNQCINHKSLNRMYKSVIKIK